MRLRKLLFVNHRAHRDHGVHREIAQCGGGLLVARVSCPTQKCNVHPQAAQRQLTSTPSCLGAFAFKLLCVLCALCVLCGFQINQPAQAQEAQAARFGLVDVFLDSGQIPLAVYQFELKTTAGDVKIVGIERGDGAGFSDPPYYDPAALSQNRIIVGAINTGDKLPAGRVRVARLHMQISGSVKPEYKVDVMTAGDKEGRRIDAKASVEQR